MPRAAIERHQPWQDHWEMEQLLCFIEANIDFVHCVLEIGTNRGGSARVWRDVFCPHLLVTVDMNHDLPEGDLDRITTILGLRSQEAEAQRQVEAALAGAPVDFLFIDGGHSYPEVWGDYEAYGGLVRSGGVIAFHDIGAGNSAQPLGCHAGIVWGEISGKGGRSVTWKNGQGTGAIIKD